MSDVPGSPKRRHILSSINPETRRSRRDDRPGHERDERDRRDERREHKRQRSVDDEDVGRSHGDSGSKSRRFRFKAKHSDSHSHSSRRHREHGSSRRHHRHQRRRSRSPENPYEPAELDPEAAFRESLFDAMADDEGAAYWQGVYGQPIHEYSNEKVGPTGELERMTDEEYAAYVRQKMWEKTHQGMLEERERRAAEKKRREREEKESRKIREEMEQSLRKGEDRRQRKTWVRRWNDYTQAWADWSGDGNKLPWPVVSRDRRDINEEMVREFFLRCLESEGDVETVDRASSTKLKDERVRWHPDKIQQKLGGNVDADVMKDVTAIFQIIDKLWNDTRPKQ
jgi:hypothetical protein